MTTSVESKIDIPAGPLLGYLAYKEEIDAAIERVLASGWYILGQEVETFEREFADYCGVDYGVGVGNGTDAIDIALQACGVGAGDEVITVANTAVATVAAIEQSGATPVLVDIDPTTFTIDPGLVEEAITPDTKAIVPVHLYGRPAEIAAILSIANNKGLFVVEDCAQAHGALYEGKRVGAWGDIAAFSFYPTKNLGAIGDGGMVVTNEPDLAERARMLRQYGWRDRNNSEAVGVNSRLDELQAAILRVKLGHLDDENSRRRDLAGAYGRELPTEQVTLPTETGRGRHVYHLYVIQTPGRDSLKTFLESRGVGTQVHYPIPIHLQAAYHGRLGERGMLPVTESTCGKILSLPMHPHLDREHVQVVSGLVHEWAEADGRRTHD